jgi:putative MATE family efflux protein
MSDSRQHTLGTRPIGRLLWEFALPAGVGMFAMALYNIVDTMFVGRVVGPLGIGGLTIVFPVQMFILSLGQMIGIGGASIVSRALGAKDINRAESTLGNVVLSACLIGGLVTAAVLPNSGFWLELLGATGTIMPFAREYINIVLIGAVFQTYAIAVNTLIRAEGNARVAMLTMLIGALSNIGLDALFILKFGMGIRGAATATVIAQAITAVYITSYYLSGKSIVRISVKNLALKANIMREILALGISSFVRIVSTSFIAVFLNRTLGSLGGDIYIATLGIITRVTMFVLMPIIAVGQGLQPILGFSYGAKRPDRAIKVINLSVKVATIIATTGFLIVFFLSNPITRIFTSDTLLIATGTQAMATIFLAWCLVGFQAIGSTVFQAIGKARPAFFTAIARQVLFLLPLILILPTFYQINGIWLSFPIADGLAFGFTLALFIPQMREFRKQESLMKGGERL